MSFNQTYAEALEKRQSRPVKPRKAMSRGTRELNRGSLRSGAPQTRRDRNASTALNGGKLARGKATRATKKAKRPKKKTDGQLKRLVWKQFSIFIRTRRADLNGVVTCVTCGVYRHWTLVDAGHFIAGRLNHNLFDERGCNEQCKFCNGPRAGNGAAYYKWMLTNHGQEVIDELMRKNDETHKWQAGELSGLLAHYKELNAANPLIK